MKTLNALIVLCLTLTITPALANPPPANPTPAPAAAPNPSLKQAGATERDNCEFVEDDEQHVYCYNSTKKGREICANVVGPPKELHEDMSYLILCDDKMDDGKPVYYVADHFEEKVDGDPKKGYTFFGVKPDPTPHAKDR